MEGRAVAVDFFRRVGERSDADFFRLAVVKGVEGALIIQGLHQFARLFQSVETAGRRREPFGCRQLIQCSQALLSRLIILFHRFLQESRPVVPVGRRRGRQPAGQIRQRGAEPVGGLQFHRADPDGDVFGRFAAEDMNFIDMAQVLAAQKFTVQHHLLVAGLQRNVVLSPEFAIPQLQVNRIGLFGVKPEDDAFHIAPVVVPVAGKDDCRPAFAGAVTFEHQLAAAATLAVRPIRHRPAGVVAHRPGVEVILVDQNFGVGRPGPAQQPDAEKKT